MINEPLQNLIITFTIFAFLVVSTPFRSFADTINAQDTEKVVQAFNDAATNGYVDYEQYKKFNAIFNKYSGRSFETTPLTEGEIEELESLVKELRETVPKWIDRLIQSAKALETDGVIKFNNPDWVALSNECKTVGSPINSTMPLDEFVEVLDKMKSNQEFDWKVFEDELYRDYGDCARHIEGFVRQVSKAKTELEKELNLLAQKIEVKELECRNKKDQELEECNDELDDLYQEFEDKEEKVTRLEKFEDESMKLKALLGLVAIIAGVVIGVYCCPNVGASIAAWGGQMLEDNQHYEKSKPVTETRKKGRRRVIEQEGEATADDIESLNKDMQGKGFKQVPVEDKTPGSLAYQIYQSEEELRIYLVKSKKLIAKLEAINVDVKENARNVVRLGSVEVHKIIGDIFIGDNRIKLNVTGNGPDGSPIAVSIVETDIGSNRFTLIVE